MYNILTFKVVNEEKVLENVYPARSSMSAQINKEVTTVLRPEPSRKPLGLWQAV